MIMERENHGVSKPLLECLSGSVDPCLDRRQRHNLIDILVIAVCAVICGAEHWTEIEDFGRCKKKWLSSFLELPHGIPSHDTFRRVFTILDPKQLQTAYVLWIQNVMKDVDVHHCCIDGKTVRGSGHMPKGKKAIHVLSAYAHEFGLVLTQSKVDDKTNEITAIPEVLRMLCLKGMIVSIDAMGCQKEIATQITGQGGEYVLSLKGNQGKLSAEVERYFACAQHNDFAFLDHDRYQTVDGDHGRVETRTYDVIGGADWLDPQGKWGGLAAVGRVQSERILNNQKSMEERLYIMSKRFSAEEFGKASRNHWGIENSPHWILDVAFDEDGCRIHAGYSAAKILSSFAISHSTSSNREPESREVSKHGEKWLDGMKTTSSNT
jgi:predicted transposase YbfD/YdcC